MKLENLRVEILEQIRDNHYQILKVYKRSNGSNASVYVQMMDMFDKVIDMIDFSMYGDEPRNITAGKWGKWYRD